MKIRRIKINNNQNLRRRGAAPIELVLCLPFLVGALAVIFTLTSVGLTKSTNAVVSRQHAWKARYNTWQTSPTLQEHGSNAAGAAAVGLILALGPGHGAEGGLLEGKDQRNVKVAHPGYKGHLMSDGNHFVLGGAWDHRRIPSVDRGKLIPSNQFTSLPFDKMPDMSGFANLLTADILGGVGDLIDGSLIEQELEKGKQLAEQQLADLQSKLSDLEDQLDQLEDADPPDLDKIQQIKDQIDEVEDQIDEVKDALDELLEEGGKLPV